MSDPFHIDPRDASTITIGVWKDVAFLETQMKGEITSSEINLLLSYRHSEVDGLTNSDFEGLRRLMAETAHPKEVAGWLMDIHKHRKSYRLGLQEALKASKERCRARTQQEQSAVSHGSAA